ncbi:acetyltransferase [Lichenibacterium minor]|uniref:Acetyltransferase n=1 Tax=Lichenibacterium minor TaxID=2316528 RepID=A0A4Q2U0R2_9HYPH|nr:acetyltransferase [Lichenibacterium minor]RYC30013.1 acetyltransferase [Lichenibacterium minor]
MVDLVIYGLGETAVLAHEYFLHDSEHRVVAFTVDRSYVESEQFRSLPVVAFEDVASSFPPSEYAMFAASASSRLNRDRAGMFAKAKDKNYRCLSYVSSRAFVWHNVEIGENCFILEHNTLQPFTKVGDNAVLWSGNHVGHRTNIGRHCFITSHVVISGYCKVGDHSFLGVNAAVADGVSIAADNYVAMGSVVQKDTQEDGVYQGNPAERRNLSAKRFCKVR